MTALDKLKRIRESLKSKEKWPRHYAESILALKTKEERIKALSEVPEHMQDLVKRHVEIAYEKNLHAKRSARKLR